MARDDKKKIKDLKNGSAANDHMVDVEGDTGDDRSNWKPSGETMDEFFALVDEMDNQVRELEEKKRNAAKPFNDKIKERKDKVASAKSKLVEDGYSSKSLNAMMRQRRLLKESERLVDELDEGQKRDFAKMQRAWKDFASIPGGLGEAADAREPAHTH
jgi:hypothetical protein